MSSSWSISERRCTECTLKQLLFLNLPMLLSIDLLLNMRIFRICGSASLHRALAFDLMLRFGSSDGMAKIREAERVLFCHKPSSRHNLQCLSRVAGPRIERL